MQPIKDYGMKNCRKTNINLILPYSNAYPIGESLL